MYEEVYSLASLFTGRKRYIGRGKKGMGWMDTDWRKHAWRVNDELGESGNQSEGDWMRSKRQNLTHWHYHRCTRPMIIGRTLWVDIKVKGNIKGKRDRSLNENQPAASVRGSRLENYPTQPGAICRTRFLQRSARSKETRCFRSSEIRESYRVVENSE